MILAHSIALDPTVKQEQYFRRAAGVSRFAFNWALSEWKRQHEAGEKPSAAKLKVRWNAIRREQFPWSMEVTKCASGQAIMNLGKAFDNFFRGMKGGRRMGYPKLRKKGQRDSFAVWNDQFTVDGNLIRLPHIGWVKMRESLRFKGKIMGATVSHKANCWHVSIQVEMPDSAIAHPRPGSIVGIDLGIATLMTLSNPLPDGTTTIANPKAHRAYLKRQRKLQRRISRQELLLRKVRARRSNRQARRQAILRKLHHHIACIREDALHKATTRISSHFERIVLEDLNIAGMGKNHSLANALHDAAFGECRKQLEYKATICGGHTVIADRFFASSKTCSCCGCIVDKLPLSVRHWTCSHCGAFHDRDGNAAKNLELVGQAMSEPLRHSAVATHGEIAALAVPYGATKLRSMNRELNRCVHTHTH